MKPRVPLGVAGCDLSPVRVGRLQPLPGVELRAEPDRAQLEQFLTDLRLPLTATGAMLELVLHEALPEPVRLALHAAHNHNTFVSQLCADYAELGRLEQDLVRPAYAELPVVDWLRDAAQAFARRAEVDGVELGVHFRSLLPDRLRLDAALLERAVGCVLQVAGRRALGRAIAVDVHYRAEPSAGEPGTLLLECATRGGAFREVELGYVFVPFRVRDGAQRPLLGLSIAQRLLHLHGGGLQVHCPDGDQCHYRIEIRAASADDAVWIDPLAPGRAIGPVRAGRVLFVGSGERALRCCRPALERAAYTVERVEREEQVLARIGREPQRYSAIVLDATCQQSTLFAFVDALRAGGYLAGLFVLVEDCTEASKFLAGVDEVLYAPDGSQLLAAMRRLPTTRSAGTPTTPACPDR